MTILSHLNWLAVIVATVVYFALGGIWYSPMGFVKGWMAGHGIPTPTDADKAAMKKQMPMYMLTSLVLNFIGVLALAYIETAMYTKGWMTGMKVGILAASLTTMTVALGYFHTKKSFKLFMIDAGYHVVGLIIVAVILSVWK